VRRNADEFLAGGGDHSLERTAVSIFNCCSANSQLRRGRQRCSRSIVARRPAREIPPGPFYIFAEASFTRMTWILHRIVAGHPPLAVYAVRMNDSYHGRLKMYLAVKAVCDAKPSVWQHSEAFKDAYTDFCVCVAILLELQPAIRMFRTVARGAEVELEVAETILTTEMDELIELFEAVDVEFVDDYTAARSIEILDECFALAPLLPAS
jgi:hypothetical protein